MKTELLQLKEKIKKLAAEGSKAREIIHVSSGMDRCRAWNDKREIGTEARFHLLAYGFLRGLSYRDMEPYSNMDFWTADYYGKLNFETLLELLEIYSPINKCEWNYEKISNLILNNIEKVAA